VDYITPVDFEKEQASLLISPIIPEGVMTTKRFGRFGVDPSEGYVDESFD
jgi:hypothetical protein